MTNQECNERAKYPHIGITLAAIFISIGLVGATYIGGKSYVEAKQLEGGVITVTGSAKKELKSDYAVWSGYFSVQSKQLTEAYSKIKQHNETVHKYLVSKGVAKDELSSMAIITNVNYVKNAYGNPTNEIEGYNLSQSIEVKSNNVDIISKLSRESTELIDKGVEFSSNQPLYFYTKIAELKVDMLALATKDAQERAKQIALNSNAEIKSLRKGKMGVFQIMPKNTNNVTDSGVDDTSAIDKEIMAVVNCEFNTKK
jgi:hypothetical protein